MRIYLDRGGGGWTIMRRSIRVVPVGAAVALCVSLPAGTGHAQAVGEEGANPVIEEVLVTARRREESAQRVPIPITALSADRLLSRGITDVANVEQLTPNMSFNARSFSRHTAQIFIRGIGQVNVGPTQDPKVGVYVDGVYLGRPQGTIFDLLDVERIEVLRGPQGTLFGRNTTAGVVQVITKKPDAEFDATVRGGIGNAGQVSAEGMVNLPLIDGVLAGRVAFQMRKDDGWMKDASGREWNTTDSRSLRGRLLWTPNDAVKVSLAAEFYRADETAGLADCEELLGGPTGFNFFPLVFGVYDELSRACRPDGNPYRSNDNDENGLEMDTDSLALTVGWDVGGLTLTSITAWRDMKARNGSWGLGTDFRGGPSFHIEVLQDLKSPYDQLSQELRVGGNAFGERLTWIAGLYGFTENAASRNWVPIMRGLPPPTDPAQAPLWNAPHPAFGTLGNFVQFVQRFNSRRQELDATNRSWAGFAEATFDVTERWAVTAGWRWTKDTREFKRSQWLADFSFDPRFFCPGNTGPDGRALRSYCKREVSYSQSTPRAIVNYTPTDDLMLYASYSRGYSSGGMNGDIRMRPYEPEISDNWEAGMKSQWFDRRLQLNASVFQNDYENQQITVGRVVDGRPIADLINAQRATIRGVELELLATPAAGWFVTLTYGFQEGEYDEFTVVDNRINPVTFEETREVRDLSDTEFLDFSPPRNLNVSVAREFPLGGGGSLTAQIGYNYRGPAYSALAITRLNRHRQPSYELVDARLRWDLANGRTSVSLWGTNLNDELYYRNAHDVVDLGMLLYYYAEPRRLGLSVEHRMGS